MRLLRSVAGCYLAAACTGPIRAKSVGERTAALPRVDAAHLPASQDGVRNRMVFHSGESWHVVLEVEHEIVRNVKIPDAAIAGITEGPRLRDAVLAFVTPLPGG